MRIEVNNLLFASDDPLCRIEFAYYGGKTYAFIQAIDTGTPRDEYGRPHLKQYWGLYDDMAVGGAEQSVRLILQRGGKWPNLERLAQETMDALMSAQEAAHKRRFGELYVLVQRLVDVVPDHYVNDETIAVVAEAKRLLGRE